MFGGLGTAILTVQYTVAMRLGNVWLPVQGNNLLFTEEYNTKRPNVC